jgi:hypothetical protein
MKEDSKDNDNMDFCLNYNHVCFNSGHTVGFRVFNGIRARASFFYDPHTTVILNIILSLFMSGILA